MANVKMPPIRSSKKRTKGKTYTYFRCSFGKIDGETLSISSPDRSAVAEWRQEKHRDLKQLGDLAADLTRGMKLDAILASRFLPVGVSLQDAAQFYRDHHQQQLPENRKTVGEAGELYIQARDEEYRNGSIREATMDEIEKKIRRFAFDFRNTDLWDCRTVDIASKVNAEWKLTPRSANQYFTVLSVFFKWCEAQGWIPDNPVARIPRHRVKGSQGKAQILSPGEALRLLAATDKIFPMMTPYIALGMYAGLRPEEIKRLRWNDIKLTGPETSIIRVEPEVSKTGQARIVSVAPILYQLLVEYSESGDRYVFYSRKLLEKIRAEAGVTWGNSILRHTFATYFLALYQDAGKTAHELGHRDSTMLYRHYAGLATAEQARGFWGLPQFEFCEPTP